MVQILFISHVKVGKFYSATWVTIIGLSKKPRAKIWSWQASMYTTDSTVFEVAGNIIAAKWLHKHNSRLGSDNSSEPRPSSFLAEIIWADRAKYEAWKRWCRSAELPRQRVRKISTRWYVRRCWDHWSLPSYYCFPKRAQASSSDPPYYRRREKTRSISPSRLSGFVSNPVPHLRILYVPTLMKGFEHFNCIILSEHPSSYLTILCILPAGQEHCQAWRYTGYSDNTSRNEPWISCRKCQKVLAYWISRRNSKTSALRLLFHNPPYSPTAGTPNCMLTVRFLGNCCSLSFRFRLWAPIADNICLSILGQAIII